MQLILMGLLSIYAWTGVQPIVMGHPSFIGWYNHNFTELCSHPQETFIPSSISEFSC